MSKNEDPEWEIVDEIPNRKREPKPPRERRIFIPRRVINLVIGGSVIIGLLIITKGKIFSLWWFYALIIGWWLYTRQMAKKR